MRGFDTVLGSVCNISFEHPESFSEINPDTNACREKLSEIVIEAVQIESEELGRTLPRFSKREHSPELLMIASAQSIQQKCPIFSKFYNCLKHTDG